MLNCLTHRTSEKLTKLEISLSKIKWDVVGLSEVGRLGENIEHRKEYIFLLQEIIKRKLWCFNIEKRI